jgi:hypothetical protein
MQHLDEGTIHAWLDGQLPRDEALEVEAHVAECRQCADAVAEARGLIAASSRILTALDGVPREVVPKQSSFRAEAEAARAHAIADAAADALVPLGSVAKRAQRRWFNGASLAAAAAIVVAIGTVTVMQRSGRQMPLTAADRPVAASRTSGPSAESVPVPSPAAPLPEKSLGDARAAEAQVRRATTSAFAGRELANEAGRRAPSESLAQLKKVEARQVVGAVAAPAVDTAALTRARDVAANKPVDELAKDTKQQAQSSQQLQAPQRREALAATIQSTKSDTVRLDRSQASADAAAGVAAGGVKGRVTDANNIGLPDVTVRVEGTNTGVVTNAAGEFAISGLQGGAYQLNVRRVGYQPVDRDITVTPGRTLQADVMLSATQTALSNVVVTGAAGAAPTPAPRAAGARAKTAAAPVPADSPPGAPVTAAQSNAVGCYELGITPLSASRNPFRQVPRRVALDSEIVPANADGVWYRARDLSRANPLPEGLWRPTGPDAIELEWVSGSRTARIRVSGPAGSMMRGNLEEIDRARATGEAANVVAIRKSCEP